MISDTVTMSDNETSTMEITSELSNIPSTVNSDANQLTALTIEIGKLTNSMSKVLQFCVEHETTKLELVSTQGKLARLETKEQDLRKKMEDAECRELSKDIVIYNLPDQQNESVITLRDSIYYTFRNDMKVPDDYIFSRNNPTGEIRIDYAYRMGKFIPNKRRPVAVTLLTKYAKEMILQKSVFSALKASATNISVSDHFPSAIREKRSALVPKLRQLRASSDYSEDKVHLRKDKLTVNNKLFPHFQFEKNPLPQTTTMSTAFKKMKHSTAVTFNFSQFIAHKITATSIDQAVAARNAIFQSSLATASHLIYAYKCNTKSGYSDDGETNGSKLLMDIIDDRKLDNIFLCVTRNKDGPNIGQKRFDLITNCAKQLLDADTSPFIDPQLLYKKL